MGLGLSLLLNGAFLARHINEMKLLTLPDLYGRKYGPLVEALGSLITIISFLALLAGNLVGCAAILAFLFPIPYTAAVWCSGLARLLGVLDWNPRKRPLSRESRRVLARAVRFSRGSRSCSPTRPPAGW